MPDRETGDDNMDMSSEDYAKSMMDDKEMSEYDDMDMDDDPDADKEKSDYDTVMEALSDFDVPKDVMKRIKNAFH